LINVRARVTGVPNGQTDTEKHGQKRKDQNSFFSNPDGWKEFSADIWIKEIITGQNRQ